MGKPWSKEIEDYEHESVPAWFYFLCFGLGIITALAFLIVIVHEIWRMNQ